MELKEQGQKQHISVCCKDKCPVHHPSAFTGTGPAAPPEMTQGSNVCVKLLYIPQEPAQRHLQAQDKCTRVPQQLWPAQQKWQINQSHHINRKISTLQSSLSWKSSLDQPLMPVSCTPVLPPQLLWNMTSGAGGLSIQGQRISRHVSTNIYVMYVMFTATMKSLSSKGVGMFGAFVCYFWRCRRQSS